MRPVATGVSRKLTVNPRPNLQHEAFCQGKTKADAATVIAHATPHIYPPRESTYSAWVTNATTEVQKLKIRVRFISVKSGLELHPAIEKMIDAKAIGTTEVVNGATPEDEPTVVVSELFDLHGSLVAHDVDWPQPLKHMTFPDRGLKVEISGNEELVVSAAKPVKGLFFTTDGVQWSDNCLDIVPGQKLRIVARGLKGQPKWMYYGM